MSMATYYIDNVKGDNENSGLCESCPKADYKAFDVKPGDTVLFKRGGFYREKLVCVDGEVGKPITYGSYGEGELPVFSSAVDLGNPSMWVEVRKNVWKCTEPPATCVGNFIFNDDELSASFRWTDEELVAQGDFCEYAETDRKDGQDLFLYSEGNPGEFYTRIEAAVRDNWTGCAVKSNNIIENLCFANSGIHGIQGVCCDNITVRGCVIKNIGGCCWKRSLRIRFGNAIEFWQSGNNILIENNYVKNVYDSCVTHQGPGGGTEPAKNFICRGNTFDTYGMAAFEYRDKMMINSAFEGNTCLNAGCGFAMVGEVLPRKSEIWPQPMGHHIFLWRIPEGSEGGSLSIKNNVFGPAPVGAAIYSIIAPAAEAQMDIDCNTYTKNDTLLVHFGGFDYTDLEEYKKAAGKDLNSSVK